MQVDKILLPQWILPVRPKGQVLENHGIAIKDGKIQALFPIGELDQFEAKDIEKLPNQLVMPGLVNAHSHASMNLLRGAGPDLSTLDWLNKVIWPAEAKLVSPEFVYQGALLGAAEMLFSGITTCHDMYFFAADAIKGLRDVGMRVVEGGFVIKYPTNEHKNEDECLASIYQLREQFKDDQLTSINVAPHAPYSVTPESLKKAMEVAEELDTTYQIHLAETQQEVKDAQRDFGCTPVRHLKNLGCLNKRTIGVHCVVLTDEDIEDLAKAGASTVHCPISNMRLGCGISPVRKLLEAGVNVALGTDGAASACRLSILDEMRLAGLLAKGISQDPSVLPCADLIDMATINGAKALGLEKKIGSIENGKEADLIAFELKSVETLPVLDIFSTVVYNIDRKCLSRIWVRGFGVVEKQRGVLQIPHRESILLNSDVVSWQNRVYEILQGGYP
ncbi:MAG: amidohydrolase family protein [Burkholderiales bacterium]|nr:amidohydrolase family protein [Burkholderiales bacterium]